MRITSAEKLLSFARATKHSLTGSRHARDAMRIASQCRADRAPSVALDAANLVISLAEDVSQTAPVQEHKEAASLAEEARKFLAKNRTVSPQ